MAIAKNGVPQAISATNSVTSNAFAVSPGGTLLTGTATMMCAFAITSPNTTPITVTSVTDSQGNTWTKVTEQASGSGWNATDINGGAQKGSTLSVWITQSATINTTITITGNFSGTTDACILLTTPKLTGVNTVQPLDQHASLPKVLKQITTVHPDLTGISTATANIWPVSFMCMFSSNILVSTLTFNGITNDNQTSLQKNNVQFLRGQVANGPAAASAYSGVTWGANSNADNVWHIGLVLTADSQTPTGPYQTQLVITQ